MSKLPITHQWKVGPLDFKWIEGDSTVHVTVTVQQQDVSKMALQALVTDLQDIIARMA